MVTTPDVLTGLLATAGVLTVVLGGYKSWYLFQAYRRRAQFGVFGGAAGLMAVVELIIGGLTILAIGTGQTLPPVWGATVVIVITAGVITFERYRTQREN